MSNYKYVDLNLDWSSPTKNKSIPLFIDSDAIKESIINIVLTPKGSALMDPDLGTEIHNFVWDPNDEISRDSLVRILKRDLLNQEPRIDIKDITAESYLGTVIIISVVYSEKDSGIEKIVKIKVNPNE